MRRPYRDERGKVWVDVTVGHEVVKDQYNQPVTNAQGQPRMKAIYDPQLVSDRTRKDLPVLNVNNATVLSKDQWIMLDTAVLTSARKRLRLWSDMRAANTFGGFDGMATPILEFERLQDSGEAVVDMDGLSDGRNHAPKFDLQGQPLPITHSDFWLSSRFLATSRRRAGAAQDTIRAEMSARRVAETIEQTALGTLAGTKYGAGGNYDGITVATVFGLTNHGDRITKTDMTAPSGSNGTTVLSEWLTVRELLYAQNFFGPYNVYVSTNYDQSLDDEFKTNSDRSLRERLLMIEGVNSITRLDYLTTDDSVLFVQLGDEIQAINGMEITTVQWESEGGMRLNFKVMGIQVPRIRSTFVNTSTTGPAIATTLKAPICHATTS